MEVPNVVSGYSISALSINKHVKISEDIKTARQLNASIL